MAESKFFLFLLIAAGLFGLIWLLRNFNNLRYPQPAMDDTIGQIAYEAYCEHTGWKSLVSGADLPPWTALDPKIQAAWEAAARAVAEEF